MEQIIPAKQTENLDSDIGKQKQFDKNFKPKGAIAFFVLLVLLGLFIWFSIYYLMLSRS
jgi:hypothetical protein